MNSPTSKLIDLQNIAQVASNLKTAFSFNFDTEKHRFIFQLDKSNEFYLRLPLPVTLTKLGKEIELDDLDLTYIIAIIQSGSAALAYCEGLQIIEHKVFKAYMVRKKQGKSQLKYLKTKGKKRGYVERQEITGADGMPTNFQIEIIKNSEDKD